MASVVSSRSSIGAGSSSRGRDDVKSLTSFNPFSEEDENEQSSYTLVTSLLSRVKNSITAATASSNAAFASATSSSASAAPVQSAPLSGPATLTSPPLSSTTGEGTSSRRPTISPHNLSSISTRSIDRNATGKFKLSSGPAQPLVSLTPVVSEAPSVNIDRDADRDRERPPSRTGSMNTFQDTPESYSYSNSIPGFPIPDDARSIRSAMPVTRSASVSKVIRRIRGEGLSKDYWMDDDTCKDCYDCKSVFTAWRRKHHCRICGLIYCSRCASNIVKGSRFGHEGMVRVCNLCLDQIAKVDEDEDDDHHSVASSAITSHFPDMRTFGHGHGRQPSTSSPLVSSTLFGRGDEPFSLFSIAESRRHITYGSEDSALNSRPTTPDDDIGPDALGVPVRPAPFRRSAFPEDEKESGVTVVEPDQPPPSESSLSQIRSHVDFPTMIVIPQNTTSSIQFPISSPDQSFGMDGPFSGGLGRSRYSSLTDIDSLPTPFIRSRVQSRLMDSVSIGEPGWRTRRDSVAYAKELNLISMSHLRTMLKQMLTTENIPNVDEWEETLLKLALRIAKEMTFTAFPQRQGQDMDVRRYVKIKKIPGGAPKDSEYVDGAVITKNVAHKHMSRQTRNPRVMLVTFPLEFHRVENQYMPFNQIMLQEKEYLGNLATRIAAVRPHVILAEKSVSGIALEELAKHHIAVARSVKPSAIQLVARVTQADIVSSMDRLLEPRFGHCQRYRIQTFDHPLIPGRRKTFMRFEGCNPSMGCTILLRGGDTDTLTRIKRITRLLAFIVRNLKLETHLWKDSIISVPSLCGGAAPQAYMDTLALNVHTDKGGSRVSMGKNAEGGGYSRRSSVSSNSSSSLSLSRAGTGSVTAWAAESGLIPDEDAEQDRLSRRIQVSLEPYLNTFISASATLRFPPPQPLRKMKELDDMLYSDKRAWEDEIIAREEQQGHRTSGHVQEETMTPGLYSDSVLSTAMPTPNLVLTPKAPDDMMSAEANIKALIESLPSPSVTKTPSPDDTLNGNTDGYFDRPVTSSPSVASTPVEDVPLQFKTVDDVAREGKLSQTRWLHAEQRRVWDWYMRKNKDDFVVEKYQRITLWEGRIPTEEFGQHPLCIPPRMKYITFYGDNDCTLGKYIEKSVHDTLIQFLDPKALCAGVGCGRPMGKHSTVYLHNETRLFVAVEQWDGQVMGQSHTLPPDIITTWSICRLCNSATPFIPVSEEMQRYSFAKFLELHFYPAEVKLVQGAGCHHNIYEHHVRYFACRGMTVRFQADPVVLHEVVYPPRRIRVRPETLLALKNSDYERLLSKYSAWYSELIDELQFISIDATTGEEEADARLNAHINMLITKAEAERTDFMRRMNRVYNESSPYDTLALNQVRAYRQDKLVAWQEEFDRLPRVRASQGTERGGGRRASAFGTMRGMFPRRGDYAAAEWNTASSSVSDAEDSTGPILRKLMTTSMSSVESVSESESKATSPKLPEMEAETEKIPRSESPPPSESPEGMSTPGTEVPPSEESQSTNKADSDAEGGADADSDSTIGVGNKGTIKAIAAPAPIAVEGSEGVPGVDADAPGPSVSRLQPAPSRLPRRIAHQPSVAELVKKYQHYLPAQGMEELTRTALAPHHPPSESEAEYVAKPAPRSILRTRRQPPGLMRKPSVSDFEHGYAANVAPKYLTQRHRGQWQPRTSLGPDGDKFVTKVDPPSPRRPSPEKRTSGRRDDGMDTLSRVARASSPPNNKVAIAGPSTSRAGKGKPAPRLGVGKEKATVGTRSTSIAPASRSTVRRSSFAPGSRVANLAKQYEKITKENERAARRYSVIRGRRARPVTSTRARVQVLDSVKDAIYDEVESSDSSEADSEDNNDADEDENDNAVEAPKQASVEAQAGIATNSEDVAADAQIPTTGTDKPESDVQEVAVPENVSQALVSKAPSPSVPSSPFLASLPGLRQQPPDLDLNGPSERNSILRALSGFWGQQPFQRGRMDVDGDDPMADPEHIFRDSSMVVRTDEPTSIIALALNSPQYRDMLSKARAEKRQAREPKLNDTGEAFMPDDRSVADSTSTWGLVNVDAGDGGNPNDDMRVSSSKLPWAISFDSGGLTISCTILFPEQFDALRRTYGCDKTIVESLARCIKWDASGGKSGSGFLKTRDERFIAKDISRSELQTMATFAPEYFDYMSSAATNNRPTLLAKIFGVFKITFKKTNEAGTAKSRTTQMNLLVMENLFYDRRFSTIYDLKGSTRNRHAHSTGRENEVLLDENLLELSQLSPIYLREHSKRILRSALFNDSKFLSDVNVMDYSLVVGVDSKNQELVVGIVDYQRTYTWDKKLESWVKDSAFLSAAKGEPTIITPKQYRQRFMAAMERYFPLIPDRWMKQRDVADEESTTAADQWSDW